MTTDTSLEERLRAALAARADGVRAGDLRPFLLPAALPRRRVRWWGAGLAGLAALAVVAVVGIGHGDRDRGDDISPAPAPTTGVPLAGGMDLDGDGIDDTIDLRPSGTLTVHLSKAGDVNGPAGVTQAMCCAEIPSDDGSMPVFVTLEPPGSSNAARPTTAQEVASRLGDDALLATIWQWRDGALRQVWGQVQPGWDSASTLPVLGSGTRQRIWIDGSFDLLVGSLGDAGASPQRLSTLRVVARPSAGGFELSGEATDDYCLGTSVDVDPEPCGSRAEAAPDLGSTEGLEKLFPADPGMEDPVGVGGGADLQDASYSVALLGGGDEVRLHVTSGSQGVGPTEAEVRVGTQQPDDGSTWSVLPVDVQGPHGAVGFVVKRDCCDHTEWTVWALVDDALVEATRAAGSPPLGSGVEADGTSEQTWIGADHQLYTRYRAGADTSEGAPQRTIRWKLGGGATPTLTPVELGDLCYATAGTQEYVGRCA
ncbi:MAG: hypothetical protein QM572_10265 [Nocardioides sp.]|uniref:hypothetical protein n=1 Tax=Nocardioides sp. TaxID=35761 RepID=UPI0039E45DEC